MRKITSYLVALLVANIICIGSSAQNVTISGNVRNSNTQENVSAVSVSIKGSSAGSFTDDKGNFSIPARSLPDTLVFSSIGYEPQEIVVTDQKKLEVLF